MKSLATVSLLSLAASAQKTYNGYGPKVTGSQNFDLDKYIETTWWNPAASPFNFNFKFSKCTTATYRKSDKYENYIDVINSQLLWKRWRYTARGHAIANDAEGVKGELAVGFFGSLPDKNDPNYYVLDTDNESFSYVWSCDQHNTSDNWFSSWWMRLFGIESSPKYDVTLWILGKDKEISDEGKRIEIETAVGILRDEFGWKEAEEFGDSVDFLETSGCPDPEF